MERNAQPLPDPTGGILTEIDIQCSNAFALWDLVKQLFYAKPECADIWDDISGNAAWDLHDTLRDAVILAICRITDPAEQGKNLNCSLRALIAEVEVRVLQPAITADQGCDLQLSNALENSVEQQAITALNDRLVDIERRCTPLREHRKKRIAHADVKAIASPLRQCPNSTVDDVLSKVASFLQEVQRIVGWPHMMYHLGDFDGSTVLMYLEAGRKLFDLKEAIERNKVSADEVRNSIMHYKP